MKAGHPQRNPGWPKTRAENMKTERASLLLGLAFLVPFAMASSAWAGGASLDDELAAMEDSGPVTPIGILEAMLFVGDRDGRPLSAAGASDLMRGVEPSEIGVLVSELNRRYETSGSPYFIQGDAGGYCLSLRKPFHPIRERFLGRVREAKLSQAAIDVLAVVAYQQPLTADQVNAMRGKPCNHVLSQMVHRGLLRIERKPGKKRLAQYFTTDRFLQLFSLQKEVRPEDAPVLDALSSEVIDLAPTLGSFADTAAAVGALDLVISVDTSTAHLAGALGRPVWVLLPHALDWRWLHEREDTPWYPTMRLFRQHRMMAWEGVISRVSAELARVVAGERELIWPQAMRADSTGGTGQDGSQSSLLAPRTPATVR